MQSMESALIALAINAFGQMLSTPGVFCHTRYDVAQDALDALENGQLTPEEALQIVQICLRQNQKSAHPGSNARANDLQAVLAEWGRSPEALVPILRQLIG